MSAEIKEKGPLLRLTGVTKRFPGVLANDGIDLDLNAGEILALLGENGAGKSTLMNIIYGLYGQDEGEIWYRGKAVHFHGPRDAIDCGIGMVHQHFQLVPNMTVTENVMLGNEIVNGFRFLKIREARKKVLELSSRYGLEVEPAAVIEELPVGVQQRVEIIKALYRNADILILDEPTSVLTPREIEDLFRIVRELKNQGKSIIFITHKLKEVLSIADRIVVMRGGRMVGEADPRDSTESSLATMMVGREVILRISKKVAQPEDVVLKVEDLVVCNRGRRKIDGVHFDVREGEVLGIAGIQGNGQTELVEALTGLREVEGGRVFLNGIPVTGAGPRLLTESGMAHIPENRHRFGMLDNQSVAWNLVLNSYHSPPYSRGIRTQEGVIQENAERRIREFDIRTPTCDVLAGTLSGGNQQKMVVAREFSRRLRLLIASQPTRGVDVGSIEFIHNCIIERRDAGVAVLLVSAELSEVLALSDRIAVMYQGKLLSILPAENASREQIGLLMAGGRA